MMAVSERRHVHSSVSSRAWSLGGGGRTTLFLAGGPAVEAEPQLLAFILETRSAHEHLVCGDRVGRATCERIEGSVRGAAAAAGRHASSVAAAALGERLAAAARANLAAGTGLDEEGCEALHEAAAIAGRPELAELAPRLAELAAAEEADLDAVVEKADALLEELVAWYDPHQQDRSMLDLVINVFRVMYGFQMDRERDLCAWDEDSVRLLLLHRLPDRLIAEDDDIERTPRAVAECLRFLGESKRLPHGNALAGLCLALSDDTLNALRDQRRFRLGKLAVLRMRDEGVDLSDGRAVRCWLETFSKRLLPRVADASAPEAVAETRPRGDSERKRRKAARKARRRSRR